MYLRLEGLRQCKKIEVLEIIEEITLTTRTTHTHPPDTTGSDVTLHKHRTTPQTYPYTDKLIVVFVTSDIPPFLLPSTITYLPSVYLEPLSGGTDV